MLQSLHTNHTKEFQNKNRNMMVYLPLVAVLLVTLFEYGWCQVVTAFEEQKCPHNWERFHNSCYKFTRSPLKNRYEARRNCKAYNADLASVDSISEHSFIILTLQKIDPQHRKWYISTLQKGGYWVNEGDGTQLTNMDVAFLPDQERQFGKKFLAYSYSVTSNKWGFLMVDGLEELLFICEIPINELSFLIVENRNYEYGLHVEDRKKIPRGPYFVKQPELTVYDKSTSRIINDVSLSCLAEGFPTPMYKWYREVYEDDVVISQEINPLEDPRITISGGSLIISTPNSNDDRGKYHCMATNKFGSIVSQSVQLSFGYINEFNLKRSNITGHRHWGKAIYCDPPQYFPEVQFLWAKNYFPNLVEEDRRIFVSRDGYLYFSSMENIDNGLYSCNLKSVGNSGKNGPYFYVSVVPHRNYQQLKFPNNFPKAFPQAPIVGEQVELECVAFGYPVPAYNWTRRESTLPRTAILSNYNRKLTIPKVTVEDEGEYVCRAYNNKFSIESSVSLSIQGKPQFTIPLNNMHMDKGSDLTWTCEAFGIPDVKYSWLRNGKLIVPEKLPVTDRSRYEIEDNVLIIRDLRESDMGMYQCKASNQLGDSFSGGQLRVLTLSPSFRKFPLESETYAALQGNVTIECNPEAAPKPRYQWRKDNVVIGSGGRRRVLSNGNLLISPVSRDDMGIYTCRATNEYGSDQSKGRLIILKGPRFIQQPQKKMIASVDQTLKLPCRTSADQILDLAYIWKHNGILIRFREEDLRFQPTGYHGGLVIHNITYAEAGEYECIAKTSVGSISTKAEVVVWGPPGPPGGVQVIHLLARTGVIQWTDGASNGRQIIHYTIEGHTNFVKKWHVIAENITAKEVLFDSRHHRLEGRKEAKLLNKLSPWSSYEFRVSAANSLGYGPPSVPSPNHHTEPDVPYIAPKNVRGGAGNTGDLTIVWDPLPLQDQNAPGIMYKVFWRRIEIDPDTEFQSKNVTQGNAGMHVVKIQSRYYFTKYNVTVQALNDEGPGPMSEETTIMSAEDMPQVAPVQVAAVAFNSTALNITWLPIEQTREKIRGILIGHRIKYWRKQDDEITQSLYYLSRSVAPHAVIVGLQPYTYYWVRVMAYNSAGPGPESEKFLERTFKMRPQKPPTSVQVYGVDPSTVRVTWRYVAPGSQEEPLLGYKVRVWEVDQDLSTARDTVIPLGGHLEAYVTHLSLGKTYNLRVLAYSQGGDGKMSSPAWVFQMGDVKYLAHTSGSSQTHSWSCWFLFYLCVTQILTNICCK